MTDAEREVLQFAAAHAVVTAEQAALLPALTGREPVALLNELAGEGLLARRRLLGGPATVYAATEDGLAEIDSKLPPAAFDSTRLRSELAAGWVWLRARDGRFEECEVLSQRELVARDAALTDAPSTSEWSRPCGLRVPGVASVHATGLHYPDVAVMWTEAWVAVHLQLVMPSPRWLAALLRAYGADERYAHLVFLVEQEPVARVVEAVAVSAGVASVVSAHWMQWR